MASRVKSKNKTPPPKPAKAKGVVLSRQPRPGRGEPDTRKASARFGNQVKKLLGV